MADASGTVIREHRIATPPSHPQPGHVEFDADALADAALRAAATVLEGETVAAVGIANQRASAVVWDHATGRPVGPGIGWQDNRTTQECVVALSHGVRLAPNQTPTKAGWLWNQVDPQRTRDIRVGTIDSWLVDRLSNGASHITDASNAYTSGFLNRAGTDWDDDVLEAVKIPRRALPECDDSMGRVATASAIQGKPPISAIVGDQQASMFGQGCLDVGDMKATFGTGGSLNICVGQDQLWPSAGSFPIVAWRQAGATCWGLEAIMLSAGSCIDWLCELGVLNSPGDAAGVAGQCDDTGDLVFVPALNGLGSPYWDMSATGMLFGMTRGTRRPEVVRAVIEGIAHRGADLVESVSADSERADELRVDGGMTANPLFVQALADATQLPIAVSSEIEATATGAARMALVGVGAAEISDTMSSTSSTMRVSPRASLDRTRWARAIERR
jgi:glycerol kinase